MKIINPDLIKKINEILIYKFGIPARDKTTPVPIDMLIATILSQNTNDKNSYKAYQNIKKAYPKWEDAAVAKTSVIENHIRTAGLANQKARTIKNVLSTLLKKYRSISLQFVADLSEEDAIKELKKFKGVGVKTASCVLLFSLNRNICPVDTHVHRTLNRIGIVKTSLPDKTFVEINKNLPKNIAHSFHTNLIKLGREFCQSQNPACHVCPLIEICKYDKKKLDSKFIYKANSFMLLDNISTK